MMAVGSLDKNSVTCFGSQSLNINRVQLILTLKTERIWNISPAGRVTRMMINVDNYTHNSHRTSAGLQSAALTGPPYWNEQAARIQTTFNPFDCIPSMALEIRAKLWYYILIHFWYCWFSFWDVSFTYLVKTPKMRHCDWQNQWEINICSRKASTIHFCHDP